MLGIFLDTETNGLNLLKHKVVEIAIQVVDLLTGQIRTQFQSVVAVSAEEWKKSDTESLRVNGFTWEETSSGLSPQVVGKAIEALFLQVGIQRGHAVFICQNPSFDRAFFTQLVDSDRQEALLWPYHWLDLASMFWARAMKKAAKGHGRFPWETGLSKDHIAQVYSAPPEKKPHRAMNGVCHLMLCYELIVGFPEKQTPSLR